MSNGDDLYYQVAIVGGGPNCVYALDRLSALYFGRPDLGCSHVHIFDSGGQFGCCAVHDSEQSHTSLLNRVAGQIGFGCDEATPKVNYILPKQYRFTFMEWLKKNYTKTGDVRYAINENDWPPRYIHGQALRSAFENYRSLLELDGRVKLITHHAEVVDIQQEGKKFCVVAESSADTVTGINDVLIATGNQTQEGLNILEKAGLGHLNPASQKVVTSIYPLAEHFNERRLGNRSSVAFRGTGVSAIDLLLYLTEGRGGVFEFQPDIGRYRYVKSGREPREIIVIGRSGLFCGARPQNQKSESDFSIETQGLFFNHRSIDQLRERIGNETELSLVGPRRQLDFEEHILPLMVLEMALLYYRRLLGEERVTDLVTAGRKIADRFIAGAFDDRSREARLVELVSPLDQIYDSAMTQYLETMDWDKGISDGAGAIWEIYVRRFFSERDTSPVLSQAAMVRAQLRFDWDYIANPYSRIIVNHEEEFRKITLQLIDRDLWEARRGNIDSPQKYACDTVWRDYRPVLTACVGFGGLTPDSEQLFLNKYLSIHNRIADGPSLDVVAKLRAMIDQRVIDIGLGTGADVQYDENSEKFRAVGALAGCRKTFEMFCISYLQRFDLQSGVGPLYKNLLSRGIVTPWKNCREGDRIDCGDGLAVNETLNPINSDGVPIENISFVGPPLEGIRFFHHTLCRSDTLQPTIKNLVVWGNLLEQRMEAYFQQ